MWDGAQTLSRAHCNSLTCIASCLYNLARASKLVGSVISFGMQGLTEPQHWEHLAETCVGRCSDLVQDALQAQPGRSTIACIDRISDEVWSRATSQHVQTWSQKSAEQTAELCCIVHVALVHILRCCAAEHKMEKMEDPTELGCIIW